MMKVDNIFLINHYAEELKKTKWGCTKCYFINPPSPQTCKNCEIPAQINYLNGMLSAELDFFEDFTGKSYWE